MKIKNGGPLSGNGVVDISRIIAGPSCSQFLGNLGANVIKVEWPGSGDNTRGWGAFYLRDELGEETSESAYSLCINSKKRALTPDVTRISGQKFLKQLVAQADVLIKNFKVGGLKIRTGL